MKRRRTPFVVLCDKATQSDDGLGHPWPMLKLGTIEEMANIGRFEIT